MTALPLTARVCAGCGADLSGMRGSRKWCSERCRKQTLYSTACVDCGAPTTGDGQYHERCGPCGRRLTGEMAKARGAEHRARVEALWAEGYTGREIARELGWTVKNPNAALCQLRNRGYRLPHRRTAEQIARMTANNGAHLHKARAVYRAQREAA